MDYGGLENREYRPIRTCYASRLGTSRKSQKANRQYCQNSIELKSARSVDGWETQERKEKNNGGGVERYRPCDCFTRENSFVTGGVEVFD